MDRLAQLLIAFGAIVFPVLHTITDVMEWLHGGFSFPQLVLNYVAFLPVPAVLLGLYAVQRPTISRLGLWGALLYGFAFVYFAHTALYALASQSPSYAVLWAGLGWTYTVHGVVMIVGGLCFGWATFRAGVLPRWTASLFLGGIGLHLLFGLLPVPDLLQTFGTLVRNAGLVGMGIACYRKTRPGTSRV